MQRGRKVLSKAYRYLFKERKAPVNLLAFGPASRDDSGSDFVSCICVSRLSLTSSGCYGKTGVQQIAEMVLWLIARTPPIT